MRTKLAIAVAGLGLFLVGTAVSLSAHHAFAAEFDANKPVTMKGTVTKMEWVNPHVWLHMDVKQPDGKMENWAFEAGTPNVLFRRGFNRKSLLPEPSSSSTDIGRRMARNGQTAGTSRSKTVRSCSWLLRHGRPIRADSGSGAKVEELAELPGDSFAACAPGRLQCRPALEAGVCTHG